MSLANLDNIFGLSHIVVCFLSSFFRKCLLFWFRSLEKQCFFLFYYWWGSAFFHGEHD
ncbi:hypothetical protein HMPREF9999_00351 [Alloprevotella sp. oral taxon 473 str. F0040]|nr:hypothetical protein HMPREF9999_00351 [Alloprevotella sp. oral taxon 473 str. F0040]